MKNFNYNLIKMLHTKLDDLWRIEKFYLRDAKKSKSKSCEKLFKEMQKDLKKEIGLLKQEIARHLKNKQFD
ncbi:MAG: hypothetical protein NTX00_01865 [Candidatus Parcubacteria bacterium]|nr:hypothetical protein [Candidatus Parcubacteria bacterium]